MDTLMNLHNIPYMYSYHLHNTFNMYTHIIWYEKNELYTQKIELLINNAC